MSGSSAAARFRLRMEDGTEVLVSSVEALARRVERGDLRPETPLFDGSTGVWSRAGDAPVVQFILEDLRIDGSAPPPEWAESEEAPSGAGAVSGASGLESILDLPVPPVEVRREESDSLDFGITLAAPPAALEPPRTVAPEAPREAEPVLPPEPAGRAPEARQWMTHAGADDLFPARPSDLPPPVGARDEGPTVEELVHPRTPPRTAEVRAPLPEASRRASGPSPFLRPGILLVGGVALVTVAALLLRAPADPTLERGLFATGGETAASTLTSIEAAIASHPAPPADLAPAVDTILASFGAAVQGAVDSLLALHGVPGTPPPQWLSGPYLADAGAMPEARDFWVGYGRVLSELRAMDRPLFLATLSSAMDRLRESRPADIPRMESYLVGRYAAVLPSRSDRMDQLVQAAGAAIALHDFLVRSAPSLRFTPALGAAVPRDPVLEVGTDDPVVLGELNDHLDALFRALDRSRGGGALSQGGLRADLFLGLGAL